MFGIDVLGHQVLGFDHVKTNLKSPRTGVLYFPVEHIRGKLTLILKLVTQSIRVSSHRPILLFVFNRWEPLGKCTHWMKFETTLEL